MCFSGQLVAISALHKVNEGDVIIGSFNSRLFCLRDSIQCDLNQLEFHNGVNLPNQTSRDQYNRCFAAIMDALKTKNCQKVVLSRIKKIERSIDSISTFNTLNETYSSTFNYLFSSPELGTWMGASPELLCSFKGNTLKTVALAGTKTQEEKWSAKEINEQKYVSKFIIEALEKFSSRVISSEIQDEIAGPVVHLKSNIQAEFDSKNWPEIVKALHPTPATCGTPTNTAFQLINKTEAHSRELYTGFIGLQTNSKKEFYVNLRCMRITNVACYLYLGGGLTIDSDLEKEWNETERKASTLEAVISI